MRCHEPAEQETAFAEFRASLEPLELSGRLRGVLLQYHPSFKKSDEAKEEALFPLLAGYGGPEDGSLRALRTEHEEGRRLIGELGLLGMHLEGYGCAGASATAYGIACIELEAGDSGVRSPLAPRSRPTRPAMRKRSRPADSAALARLARSAPAGRSRRGR